tara:strand:+ start:1197 stop:2006 length:810 start_codon:yes stop_codon:yes gene_type:complete
MTVLSTINDYLYIGSLFLAGTFGAFAFTSYCIVNKDYKKFKQTVNDDTKKREEDELKQQEEDETNSYENKYSLKKALHNEKHCDLSEKYIFEATPDGVIILNYDIENKSFNYWSDQTINYKYLQTAARRFVFDYQCKDYYIQCDEKDEKNHCGTNKNNNKQTCEEDPLCVCDSTDCKLPSTVTDPIDRNYNEAEQDIKEMRSKSEPTTETTPDDNVFVKTKKNKHETKKIVANKYSHKGDLIDFYGPTSKRKTGKDISFAEFMKQNKEH